MKIEVPKSNFKSVAVLRRVELANQFHLAHPDTLFDEEVIAAVFDCSKAHLQRDRWQGGSIPFVRLGRSIRYKKSDVIAWLNQCQSLTSTSQEVYV